MLTAQEVYAMFEGDVSQQRKALREEYTKAEMVKTFLDSFEASLFSHSHHQHPTNNQSKERLESKLKQNEQPRKKFVLALGDALKLDELKANEVLTNFLLYEIRKLPQGQPLSISDFTDIEFLHEVCGFYFTERDKTWHLLCRLLRVELDKDNNPHTVDVCEQLRGLVSGCVALMQDSLYLRLKDHLDKLYDVRAVHRPTGNVYQVYVERSGRREVDKILEQIHVWRKENTLIEMEKVLDAMILLTQEDLQVVRFVEFQHFLSIATKRNFSAPRRGDFIGIASSSVFAPKFEENFYNRYAANISFKYLMHFCNTLDGGYAD